MSESSARQPVFRSRERHGPAPARCPDELDLSIIIPIYNEEGSIPSLEAELVRVMDLLPERTEVLFVDDGSKDATPRLLAEITTRHAWAKVVKLRRNFGQTQAMAAGFAQSCGKVLVCMDGDLQNDAEDIPRLLEKMEEGFDIVSGWRRRRQDRFLTRRLPSICANWLIGQILGVRLHDYGCSLKAYNARVMKALKLYSDMHRFLPALARRCGARVTEISVNHRPRAFGKSKYGLSRVLKVMIDIVVVKFVVDFSDRPSHAFGVLGSLSLFICWLTVPLFVYNQNQDYRTGNVVLPAIIALTAMSAMYYFIVGIYFDLIIRASRHDASRYARSTMVEI
jgi:glycosyltransferase involved in cell wall biosynthesis